MTNIPKGNRIHPTFNNEEITALSFVAQESGVSFSTLCKIMLGVCFNISNKSDKETQSKVLESLKKHSLIKEEFLNTDPNEKAVDVEIVSKETTNKLKMRKI